MQIINARDQKVVSIPLVLGETGRGRWAERVEIARQPDRKPESGASVGYFLVPAGADRSDLAPENHVVLTRPVRGQTGTLVRISSEGCYTKYRNGSVSLLFGDALRITHGCGAVGDAGKLQQWTDELWHCKGAALFGATLAGGSSKGYGPRLCVVTEHGQVSWWKPEQLRIALATGADAGVEAVCRAAVAAGAAPEIVVRALEALDLIESDDAQVSAARHYWDGEQIREPLEAIGLAVPATWNQDQGVSEIRDGALIPGEHALVVVRVNSGGGKRWRLVSPSWRGLDLLHSAKGTYVFAVSAPDWALTWGQTRDGELNTEHLINPDGQHVLNHEGCGAWSRPWPGANEPAQLDYQSACTICDQIRTDR